MGFLSGVLDAVKDDDAVKTYNDYMPVNDRLEKVLDTLTKNIGSGRDGLVEAVGAVKGWLEGYGVTIEQKARDVTDHIEMIRNSITETTAIINNRYTEGFDIADQQVASFLEVTKKRVNRITGDGDVISKLDTKLKSETSHPIHKIKQAVDAFRKSAENKDLQELNKYVGSELCELEKRVENKVTGRIIKLRNMLQDEFNKYIYDPIKKVKEKLTSVDNDLKTWISAATQLLENARKTAQNDVHEKMDPDNRSDQKGHPIGYHISELNKAHGKSIKGQAKQDESIQGVLEGGVADALGQATTLLNEKIGVSGKNHSEFKKLDDTALDIYTQANLVYEAINIVDRGILPKLEAISEAIIESESGVAAMTSIDEFSQNNIQQITDFNIDEIKQILDTLSDHMNTNYCGFNNFKTAFNKHIEIIKAQLKAMTETSEHLSRTSQGDLKERLLQELHKLKSQCGKHIGDFIAEIQNIKRQKGYPAETMKTANSTMQKLNTLSQSVSEATSKLIALLHFTQTNISKEIRAIWDKNGGTDSKGDGFMKTVRDNIPQLRSEVIIAIGEDNRTGGSSLRYKIEQAREQLHGIARTIKDKLDNDIQSKLTRIQSVISSSVITITSQLGILRNTLNTQVIDEINKLSAQGLQNSEEKWDDNKTAKGLGDIQKRVAGIIGETDGSQSETLEGIIKKAAEFLNKTLPKETGDAIQKITEYVQGEIQNRTTNITNKAQELYANRKQQELQSLQKIVEKAQSTIEVIIKHDKTNGLKGLLRKLRAENAVDILSLRIQAPTPSTSGDMAKQISKLSRDFKTYVDGIAFYVADQVGTPTVCSKQATQVDDVRKNLDYLLDHLKNENQRKIYNCDHKFTSLLSHLSSSLTSLRPSHFANPRHPELLDAVKKGLQGFVEQMGRVYVNGYDGSRFVEDLTKTESKFNKVSNLQENITVLTDYGRKCSKVCLTSFSIIHNAFKSLRKYGSARWRLQQVKESTELGKYFINHGYRVATDDVKQWELQDKNTMAGKHIHKRLVGNDDQHVYKEDKTYGPLEKLNDGLQTYYNVGHVTSASAKKRPSNIFEILCWISGLPSNNVYEDVLHGAVSDLFVDPAKQVTVGELSASVVDGEPVPAYPHSIELERTQAAVTRLCSKSYDVLVRILGYGDAYTMYAVDFGNNALNFHYPPKAGDCLQMLIDMLRTLLPPLRFLHRQCKLSAEFHGWSECFYGKEVRTTKWTCTDHSSDEVTCQPNCQPKGKANCQPTCQPTSPLQSYLSDCLPGRLPHDLSSIGCKYDCRTCSKSQPGQPCLTPLGFRGFSGSAKSGKNICDVLDEFFNNEKLLALFTLFPQPPANLPEHFGFALSLAAGLNASNANKYNGVVTLQDALETSVKETSMDLYNEGSALITAFSNAYRSTHGDYRKRHPDPKCTDLSSLSMATSCMVATKDNVHCGPYLSSLYSDAYYYLAPKHCSLYLSWAVYLPWTLYRYLQGLFDSFCNISCQDWGCRGCLQNEKCKKGKHGEDYNCKCRGIVECRGVMSVFHTYGFSFGDASKLMSTDEWRYCRNFHAQFKNVLKSEYFTTLFEKCDNILFAIRQPFIWLNVALWLLSLFYLLCVMVGRLDVLHIRSHLRIPSSHRITAQSLLAAAQVGRLAKISYLQP